MPILATEPTVAARALLAGRLAALPTETVYGLAADATNVKAVSRCFAVKGRPTDHPLIVHIRAGDLGTWSLASSSVASALAAAFWPGPLTLVVRKPAWVPGELTGGQDTVALRCVDHPAFAAVLSEVAELAVEADEGAARPVGLAAPSANLFSQVSPTTALHVLSGLGNRLNATDVILDGGPCAVGIESTIVDCSGESLRVLRPGAIGVADLRRALGAAGLDPGLVRADVELGTDGGSAPVDDAGGAAVRVPGALRSHYSPRASVRAVTATELTDQPPRRTHSAERSQAPSPAGVAARLVGLIAPADVQTPLGVERIAAPADVGEYARGLYAWMRSADGCGCAELLVVLPESVGDATADASGKTHPTDAGLVAAIRDRVTRAAAPDRAQPSPNS